MSNKCILIGDTFGVLIQLLLLVTAVGTLVYKRHIETPQRSWLIWGFDTSKQAFAGSLQHTVNMILGLYFGSKNGLASECIWYILNLTITSFCGVFILYFVMKCYNKVITKYNITLLKSGDYGDPPMIKAWALQLFIWGVISCLEKLFTAFVLILPLYSVLDSFASLLESPLVGYPHVELVIVMVLMPAVVNSMFFWACDNIIKEKKAKPQLEISGYQEI